MYFGGRYPQDLLIYLDGGQELKEKGESKDNTPVSDLSNWMDNPFVEITGKGIVVGILNLLSLRCLCVFHKKMYCRQSILRTDSSKRCRFGSF